MGYYPNAKEVLAMVEQITNIIDRQNQNLTEMMDRTMKNQFMMLDKLHQVCQNPSDSLKIYSQIHQPQPESQPQPEPQPQAEPAPKVQPEPTPKRTPPPSTNPDAL
jgi:outer membrane biosynthesis protein TonB